MADGRKGKDFSNGNIVIGRNHQINDDSSNCYIQPNRKTKSREFAMLHNFVFQSVIKRHED